MNYFFLNILKQSINGGESFQCQHGAPECDGNMIQSCVLYALNGLPDAKMEYVACQMQFGADATGQTVGYNI